MYKLRVFRRDGSFWCRDVRYGFQAHAAARKARKHDSNIVWYCVERDGYAVAELEWQHGCPSTYGRWLDVTGRPILLGGKLYSPIRPDERKRITGDDIKYVQRHADF